MVDIPKKPTKVGHYDVGKLFNAFLNRVGLTILVMEWGT